MRKALLWPAAVACALFAGASAGADSELVVVPETSHVDITPEFTGADIKAFGAMGVAGDLIIKVEGPEQRMTLSRQIRLGPFWIGGGRVRVTGAPGLLYLYATQPIASMLAPAEREKFGLLLEEVPVRIEPQLLADAAKDWRQAFFRLKEKENAYREDDRAITIYGNRLFVADIQLPGDLQVGTYNLETLLVKSGKVVDRHTSHFEVRQVGIERWVSSTARRSPWLFGLLFTLAAMLLGFALNVIFHR